LQAVINMQYLNMEKIEHIGIAVNSIAQAGSVYEKLLGTKVYKTEEVASEGVLTAFLQCGPNKIELLQALNDDSPIAKFLAKKGEGMHHIAFEVTDIRAEMARLKSEGFVLLNDEPKQGADNKLVCFVHPKGVNGVLVELCESSEVNVLDKYRITFFKKMIGNRYYNCMNSVNETLNTFLTDYDAPTLVKEFIIDYIDKVFTGFALSESLVAQCMISAVIKNDNTMFFTDPDYLYTDKPDFSIPTQDFKKIAELWMEYLQENGI